MLIAAKTKMDHTNQDSKKVTNLEPYDLAIQQVRNCHFQFKKMTKIYFHYLMNHRMEFNLRLYLIPINFTIKDTNYMFTLISCFFLFIFFKVYFAKYLGFFESFANHG